MGVSTTHDDQLPSEQPLGNAIYVPKDCHRIRNELVVGNRLVLDYIVRLVQYMGHCREVPRLSPECLFASFPPPFSSKLRVKLCPPTSVVFRFVLPFVQRDARWLLNPTPTDSRIHSARTAMSTQYMACVQYYIIAAPGLYSRRITCYHHQYNTVLTLPNFVLT